MYQYSLIDISTIKENLKEYYLDTTIIDSINELTSSLNLQITKPKPYKKEKQIYDDEGKWTKREIFKTTKLEKKEGIDEKLDIFRGILNKMVSSNYDEIKDQLMEIFDWLSQENYRVFLINEVVPLSDLDCRNFLAVCKNSEPKIDDQTFDWSLTSNPRNDARLAFLGGPLLEVTNFFIKQYR